MERLVYPDCCFCELASIKNPIWACCCRTKRTSSSSYRNVTCLAVIKLKIAPLVLNNNHIQLSLLLECDPTVCLSEKSKVTRGLARGWPNFSRGDKQSGHTPTRVIIGILYRIFLHQKFSSSCSWSPYPTAIVPFLLHLQRRTCRWTPYLWSVESREVTIIGNTWGSCGNFLGPYYETLRLVVDPTNG